MVRSREVISIHVGQAGVQIGTNCWELYCLEHGLDTDGTIKPVNGTVKATAGGDAACFDGELESDKSAPDSELTGTTDTLADGFGSFFIENSNGSYSPRALLVDLEPTVIDQVRNGRNKKLYSSCNMVSGNEDAANNFARGFCTTGKVLLPRVIDPIIKMVEGSDKLQGFMIYHSYGGGTGSGFHSLLSQELSMEYPKLSKIEIALFPSPTMSTAVVEPYNAILTNHATLDITQCVFVADNEAMYHMCQSRLDIDNPHYSNLNRLLAQTLSSITASLRFKGTLNTDFSDFQTNLVPFPKIHFPVMSYAPIASAKNASLDSCTVSNITSQCFDPSNRLMKCDMEKSSYMSCCLLYRGDVTPKDVNAAIAQIKLKKEVNFVPWSPTGFKIGINSSRPILFPNSDLAAAKKAICMLCNTTALKDVWREINRKYTLMLRKNAFVHWFTDEGLKESDIVEAQETVLNLEEEYDLMLN